VSIPKHNHEKTHIVGLSFLANGCGQGNIRVRCLKPEKVPKGN
jgi:hypothetical protein